MKFFSQLTKKLDICGQGGGKMQREGWSASFEMGVKKGLTDRQWSIAKFNKEPYDKAEPSVRVGRKASGLTESF